MRVQWTRLPGGLPTPEFVEQVKRLLDGPRTPHASGRPGGIGLQPMNPDHRQGAGATQTDGRMASPRARPTIWIVVAIAVVVTGGALWLRRPAGEPTEAPRRDAVAASPDNAKPQTPNPKPMDLADAKSIAVLPFENMSEEKENAFFAEGVHEDVLTNLSFIRDLRVVSRTSVMQYRGTTKSISQIAQELKVAYVLEGSVRRAGNKVRVTGQLIRAATDEHVWAKAYDRDVTDVFAIQGELAQAIAAALQSVIAPEAKALLERKLTDNPAAHDLYLRARQQRNSGNFDASAGIELLQRAVALDPNFAAAWAELASRRAYTYLNFEQTPQLLGLAKTAIEQAAKLAPDDPEVVEGLGDYYYYGYRNYARATEQYLRLSQLRPGDSAVFSSLAFIQRRQGRMPDALPNFRRAVQLDPENLTLSWEFIGSLMNCRHYAEAETFGRQSLKAHPGRLSEMASMSLLDYAAHGSTETIRALAARDVPSRDRPEFLNDRLVNARATGDWAEAIRIDHEQRYYDGDATPHWWQDTFAAATLAEAGDPTAARARAMEAVAAMKEETVRQPLNAQLWATLSLGHALLGEHDEALRCGEKSRELLPESRDALLGVSNSALCASALAYAGEKDRALAEFERLLHVPFGVNAMLDRGIFTGSWKPLRDDPRFQALINDPKNNAPIF